MKDRNQQDLGLILKYKETKDTAFVAELMDRYSSHIIAFGVNNLKNREDVKDFTNDIFLKLCDKLYKDNIANFKSWLYIFMKNMFYDQKRKQQLHLKYLKRQTPNTYYLLENQLLYDIDKKHLYSALDRLADKEKRCVHLLYMEGKNYGEIMSETGWTFNQVRGIRDRATRKLKATISLELKEMINK